MTELKKLEDAIVLMEAIKSTLQDNPKHVNEETRKQRFHQAQDVMTYLRDTRYALIMANEKAEKQALTYEEEITLWKNRAKRAGYNLQKADARETNYEPFTF